MLINMTITNILTVAIAGFLFIFYSLFILTNRANLWVFGGITFDPCSIIKFLAALLATFHFLGEIIKRASK